MKWIKNDSGGNKTWLGQVVADTTYYEVQSHEEVQWANDSTLLVDICSGDAVVARDDSGSSDFTDISEAINYLKYGNVTVKNERYVRQGGASNKFLGTKFTATKNATTTHDFKIVGDFYLHSGHTLCDKNAFGDYINMYVVDVDAVTYPAGTVMKHYVENINIYSDGINDFETDEKTEINLKNYYIRVKYTSVGTVDDVSVAVNMRGFDS